MRRLIVPLASIHLLFAVGAAWYAFVEGFGLFDGIYMVVITLTTVGYDEVRPLDASGRAFTMLFLLGGVGLMFYTAVALVEHVIVSGVVEGIGERRFSRRYARCETTSSYADSGGSVRRSPASSRDAVSRSSSSTATRVPANGRATPGTPFSSAMRPTRTCSRGPASSAPAR